MTSKAKEGITLILAMLATAIAGGTLGYFLGQDNALHYYHREAVKAGAAEYTHDEAGMPVFQWRKHAQE